MSLSELNYTSYEEAEIVSEQMEKASSIFASEAFADGDPIMCQLHDAFGTYDTSHHNCLGCNFADSILIIYNFLQTYPYQNTIQSSYSTFIVLAYLLVERTDTLFNIIELNTTYRVEHFKILIEIRKWANFLKHPKAFLLTHHPTFTFTDSPKNKVLIESASVKIDRSFVEAYYSDDEKNNTLYKELENKDNVLVIFPNMVTLSIDLCKAMRDCVEVVRDNPVYREVIERKTTFYDYWVDVPGSSD